METTLNKQETIWKYSYSLQDYPGKIIVKNDVYVCLNLNGKKKNLHNH